MCLNKERIVNVGEFVFSPVGVLTVCVCDSCSLHQNRARQVNTKCHMTSLDSVSC